MRFIPLFVLVISCFMFVACGGSSSGKSLSSSSSSSQSSDATLTTITLDGVLAHPKLNGADVQVVVGDQRFAAVAGANNRYNITLSLSAKNATVPIYVNARAKGGANTVEMASLLPSASQLRELFGGNTTITGSDFLGVNVSAMTTAEYVLMHREFQALNSDDLRASALISLSLPSVARLATLIQYYASIDAGFPVQVESTLALAIDEDLAKTYENILFDFYDGHKYLQEILQDPDQSVLVHDIKGTYIAATNNTKMAFLELGANGIGHIDSSLGFFSIYQNSMQFPVKAPFHWSLDGSVITLTFDNLVVSEGRNIEFHGSFFCDEESDGVCQIRLASMTLEIRADREGGVWAGWMSSLSLVHNGDIVANSDSFLNEMTLYKKPFVELSDDAISDSEWVSASHAYHFAQDGSGARTQLRDNLATDFAWSIVNGEIQLDDGNSLLPISRTRAGYKIVEIDRSNESFPLFSLQDLVKKQQVIMDKTDWLGRWLQLPIASDTNYFDLLEDGIFTQGPWALQGEGDMHWTLVNDRKVQLTYAEGVYSTNDLLAVHDDIAYFSGCFFALNFSSSCLQQKSIRVEDVSTPVLWPARANQSLVEKHTGNVWFFEVGQFYINDESSAVAYSRVSATRLFIPDRASIMELTTSSQDEIVFCEYPIGESCDKGEKYYFSVVR